MCPYEITAYSSSTEFKNPILERISIKFPSFRFFYDQDKKTLSDTANSLAIIDHFTDMSKAGHRALIGEYKNPMSFGDYCHLCNLFYLFRVRPEYLKELELFIYLDGVSRTEAGKKLTRNLPAEKRYPKYRDQLALNIIDYDLLTETHIGDFRVTATLRDAFGYRLYITGKQPEKTFVFSEDGVRLAQAGTICRFAGVDADLSHLGTTTTLKADRSANLVKLVCARYNDPESAKALCLLADE